MSRLDDKGTWHPGQARSNVSVVSKTGSLSVVLPHTRCIAHQGGKDWRLVQVATEPLRLLNAALDSTVSQQLHRVVDMPLCRRPSG